MESKLADKPDNSSLIRGIMHPIRDVEDATGEHSTFLTPSQKKALAEMMEKEREAGKPRPVFIERANGDSTEYTKEIVGSIYNGTINEKGELEVLLALDKDLF